MNVTVKLLLLSPKGFYSLRSHRFIGIGIAIIKLTLSSDSFMMGIPISTRQRLYNEYRTWAHFVYATFICMSVLSLWKYDCNDIIFNEILWLIVIKMLLQVDWDVTWMVVIINQYKTRYCFAVLMTYRFIEHRALTNQRKWLTKKFLLALVWNTKHTEWFISLYSKSNRPHKTAESGG